MNQALTDAAARIAALSIYVEPPEDGAHTAPMDEYLRWDALNSGLIPHLLRSPRAAHWRREHPEASKPAADLGTAMHMCILEPERFATVYAIVPGPWNANPGKKLADEAKAAGLVPLKPDDYDACLMARENVLAHETLGPVFADPISVAERSLVWTVQAANGSWVRCKARPDLLAPAYHMLLDIKTHSGDITAERFIWSARDYAFDVKLAWYLRGCEALEMPYNAGLIVAIEQDGPCDLIPYAIHPSRLAVARAQCEYAVNVWAECKVTNEWRGYSAEIRTLFEEV